MEEWQVARHMHYVCFCDSYSVGWVVDEEDLLFMPDSKVVYFKWRFLWNTVISLILSVSKSFEPEIIFFRVLHSPSLLPTSHLLACMFYENWPDLCPKLALFGKAFLLRVEGAVAELAAGKQGKGLREKWPWPRDGAACQRRMIASFPFSGRAFLVFSGFACTPW